MRNDYQIPQKIAREHAETFAEEQRHAFLAGFEAAVQEAESFTELREWLPLARDEARENYEDDDDHMQLARYHAFVEVLVKLAELGCRMDDAQENPDATTAERTEDEQ